MTLNPTDTDHGGPTLLDTQPESDHAEDTKTKSDSVTQTVTTVAEQEGDQLSHTSSATVPTTLSMTTGNGAISHSENSDTNTVATEATQSVKGLTSDSNPTTVTGPGAANSNQTENLKSDSANDSLSSQGHHLRTNSTVTKTATNETDSNSTPTGSAPLKVQKLSSSSSSNHSPQLTRRSPTHRSPTNNQTSALHRASSGLTSPKHSKGSPTQTSHGYMSSASKSPVSSKESRSPKSTGGPGNHNINQIHCQTTVTGHGSRRELKQSVSFSQSHDKYVGGFLSGGSSVTGSSSLGGMRHSLSMSRRTPSGSHSGSQTGHSSSSTKPGLNSLGSGFGNQTLPPKSPSVYRVGYLTSVTAAGTIAVTSEPSNNNTAEPSSE